MPISGSRSQKGTRGGFRLGGLFCLGLAACATRPAPRAESARSSYERDSTSDAATGDGSKSDPTVARTFGWLGIAVGAESAIVATVTSVMMLEDKSTRDAQCHAAKMCSSSGLHADTQLGSLAGWNAGAWVLAAAGLGVGSALLLTHPVETHPLERHATLTVSPFGVSLAGDF